MTRRIDIGGKQGRSPEGVEVGRHAAQNKLGKTEQTLTDLGLLAELNYSEPERLELPPLTRVERLLLWLIAAISVAGIGTAVVSCTA
jgi:hypothetical protein